MAIVNFAMLSIPVKDRMSRCIGQFLLFEHTKSFSRSFRHYSFFFFASSHVFFPSCPFLSMYLGRIKKGPIKNSRWHYTIFYHACSCWTVVFLHVLDWAPRILKLIINAMSCKIYQAISTTCQIYIKQKLRNIFHWILTVQKPAHKVLKPLKLKGSVSKETMLAQQSKMRFDRSWI
jgi:hypothetical protein